MTLPLFERANYSLRERSSEDEYIVASQQDTGSLFSKTLKDMHGVLKRTGLNKRGISHIPHFSRLVIGES